MNEGMEEKLVVQDQKFVRGQVWWLRGVEAHKHKIVNGIEVLDENGTRPVIIISNNIVNRSKCDYVTVVPCTSNTEREHICTNITYLNCMGKKNCVQTNQIMSVEKSKLINYQSTLDNEVIEKIEQAIKIQMGIEECEGDYFGNYRKPLKPVEFSTNSNVKSEIAKVTNIDSIKNENEDKLKVNITQEGKTELVPVNNNEVFDPNDVWDLPKWKTELKKGRLKWSVNREIEFMKFYEEMGVANFSKAIDMKVSTMTNRAYLLKKKYKEFLSQKSWLKAN